MPILGFATFSGMAAPAELLPDVLIRENVTL
jgi:hypothetical protein